jgi:hypothetical protein
VWTNLIGRRTGPVAGPERVMKLKKFHNIRKIYLAEELVISQV